LDELLPCAFSQAVTRTELTSANRLHGFSSALAQQMRVTFEIDGTETQFSKFYQSSIMRLRQQYREERRQCFRQITSKTAPWRLDRHVRKRLSSACAYFCPLKFKFVRKTANQEDVMPRSFQSNATWIRRTRQTPIRLTLHSDRFAINQPNGKRLDIEKSEIAEAFLTPKTDEKKSRVLWVLRSRRAILLECSDPVFNKISLGNETFFNAEWIQEWAARRMSSFELLMRLNLSFGRSFEDSCHYPIVPPLDIPSSTVDFFFSSGVLPIADVYANRRRLEHSDLKGWIESNFPIELPNRHPFYETEMTIKRIETGFAGPTEALIDPDVYLYRDCQLLKVSADGFQEVQNLPKIPGSVLVAQFGSYFVVSGLKASRFEMVSKKDLQSQFYSVGNDQITAICGGGSCVILAMKNTIVRVVEAEGRARSIPVYLHSITCVTFNPLFDVVAVGDKWGNVVLCFLSTGEVFQHVKLKRKRIVKVHLTYSWGLLVIEAAGKYGRDHWVYVYTQDGQRLGEWGLSRELAGIASFASGSGFDHLVLADLNGAVFILDPVKLANGRPSSRLNRALVGVGYDAASGAVVTADRTGQVVYIQKQWE
jgi:hypothetical protein